MFQDKDEKERRKLNRKLLKRSIKSEMKNRKAGRYETQYMSIGICLGISCGLMFGNLIFPDNMTIGMCLGLPIGMSLGMTIGQNKDRQLFENKMEISRIEHLAGCSEIFIYAIDKNGVEKEFRVSEKMMKSERFAIGDWVAEEKDGVLVSLESKPNEKQSN